MEPCKTKKLAQFSQRQAMEPKSYSNPFHQPEVGWDKQWHMVTLVRRATWQQNREKGLIYEICNRLAFLSLSKKCQWQWEKQTLGKASLKRCWTSCLLKSFHKNRGRTVGLALVSELTRVDKVDKRPCGDSRGISVMTQESIPQRGDLLCNRMVP